MSRHSQLKKTSKCFFSLSGGFFGACPPYLIFLKGGGGAVGLLLLDMFYLYCGV